jgi:Uma2 family endonuclease
MSVALELERNVNGEFAPNVLPDRYEVIDGQIVEMPPMSDLASTVASRLHVIMGHHAFQAGLGETLMEALVKLPAPIGRKRRPDVWFVSFDRWPKNKPVDGRENGREVAPDLAVEVVSPSDFGEDDQEKLVEFFRAGVRQVWLIYPRLRLLYIYDSITSVRGFTENDVIDCAPILPGLKFTLKELFPEQFPA